MQELGWLVSPVLEVDLGRLGRMALGGSVHWIQAISEGRLTLDKAGFLHLD